MSGIKLAPPPSSLDNPIDTASFRRGIPIDTHSGEDLGSSSFDPTIYTVPEEVLARRIGPAFGGVTTSEELKPIEPRASSIASSDYAVNAALEIIKKTPEDRIKVTFLRQIGKYYFHVEGENGCNIGVMTHPEIKEEHNKGNCIVGCILWPRLSFSNNPVNITAQQGAKLVDAILRVPYTNEGSIPSAYAYSD